ncbi:MAG: NUDIX domain-containing protein [bacterium]|nr:NUDIX domain-containing protein [bacterium]
MASSDLAEFLGRHHPFAEAACVWGDGTLPLRECFYLGKEIPPLEYVTSVRSLVFKGELVLVLQNRHSTHILPGGRREPGETLEETLRREVMEESGWTISGISLVGFMHFHHLKPRPPGYGYPHPDFVQLVYASEAVTCVPESRVPDDYEAKAYFCPNEDLEKLGIAEYELHYLNTALKTRQCS